MLSGRQLRDCFNEASHWRLRSLLIMQLSLVVGQLVQSTNPQKENQGQGHQCDRDRGSFKERDNYRRQGGWDRNQHQQTRGRLFSIICPSFEKI